MTHRTDTNARQFGAQRGNVWSGIVALVLLGLFAIALVSSEIQATGNASRTSVADVIAGQ